ncbi:hypothetical protein J3L18_23670 [Mucilaginibacter gossypii]|uniref:hypothetical protein n=1 Tax=Mucilaginibacter gossypii TaxID=551996 RepID=UPI000DCC4DA2|nr:MULTISPECIES: hypothetical protein [Mucilaginibacter]QTE36104.1 hypothetical protein J3L18_23670 [Mucilaginibacter gossypii]RAV59983.1 hypothetical protein DIU36_03145 [Mucilaginibacter rubeus]
MKCHRFIDFFEEAVVPYKERHKEHIRLDGRTSGGNRKAFGHFYYQDKYWKVDSDTWIEKLDIAFNELQKGVDPFRIMKTRNSKNECLIITGQKGAKHFYVYAI